MLMIRYQHLLYWERQPCTERKSLNQECGWKDGDRGGPARMRRNPQEGKRKQKEKTSLQERRRKTSLTLTGLLMEGPTGEQGNPTFNPLQRKKGSGCLCRLAGVFP